MPWSQFIVLLDTKRHIIEVLKMLLTTCLTLAFTLSFPVLNSTRTVRHTRKLYELLKITFVKVAISLSID